MIMLFELISSMKVDAINSFELSGQKLSVLSLFWNTLTAFESGLDLCWFIDDIHPEFVSFSDEIPSKNCWYELL